jgi:hypothetical protein
MASLARTVVGDITISRQRNIRQSICPITKKATFPSSCSLTCCYYTFSAESTTYLTYSTLSDPPSLQPCALSQTFDRAQHCSTQEVDVHKYPRCREEAAASAPKPAPSKAQLSTSIPFKSSTRILRNYTQYVLFRACGSHIPGLHLTSYRTTT